MTTPTDRPNLDRLRELDKAATSAPWSAADERELWREDCPDVQPSWCVSNMRPGWESMSPEAGYIGDVADCGDLEHDAALIAAYRNATPALVAALTDVLALHQLVAHCPDGNCTARTCANCGGRYPCPTVRAISTHLDLTNGA